MDVKCIDNFEQEDKLTIGKVYQKTDERTMGDNFFYLVRDDTGHIRSYFSDRFEIVKGIFKE